MRQEYPFRPFVSPFADSPVVRWIQKRQTEGLDGAMHIEAVAMNQLIDNRGRLFRTIRVQLDPVAARARFCSNCQERCTVPDAWINRLNRRIRMAQVGLDSPGFAKRQREVAETEPSLISHGYSFPVSPGGGSNPTGLVRLKDSR
jgi:hypothetical protein